MTICKRVLVTGASGYIGRHIVAELSKFPEFFQVEAWLGPSGKRSNFIYSDNVSYSSIDIFSVNDEFIKKYKKIDIVIHAAWRDGFIHNSPTHIQDLSAHFNLLKSFAEAGTKHFAVLGSFREYGAAKGEVSDIFVDPQNLYHLSKWTLKKSLELYLGPDICLQWLRPFSVYGDDQNNHSIFSKILQWESEGKKYFPFTEGSEQYDYIHVNEVAKQVVATIAQTKIKGVIDICTGVPTSLKYMVENFIKMNRLNIRPKYGAYKTRSYDSPVIYGNNKKIKLVLETSPLYGAKNEQK